MLASLKIENFALIDHLDLTLQPGLNVLTGETGAGKSIILDAIDAVLGGKATGRWVRTGTDKAFVEAAFALQADPRIAEWLSVYNIPAQPKFLTCRRELTATKSNSRNGARGSLRSRFWLNDVVVKKPQMADLRRLLIEITAQGQTLQLGSPDLQRDWLDGFGDRALIQQREQVARDYEQAVAVKKLLETRRQAEQQRTEQLDMFTFQSQELGEAALEAPDELETLQIEHHRLSHGVELQQQSYQVYQTLYERESSEACADMLGQAESVLSDMLRFDPQINPILEMVSDALAQVQEAGRQINTYGAGLETDPQRLLDIDQRMAQLQQLCRKYNRDLPELIEYYQGVQASLATLHGDGQSVEVLESDYRAKQQVLIDSCDKLTKRRQKAATILEKELVAQLKPLAMERVKFKVDIRSQPPTAQGADLISFLFSPNPGEPLQPLVDIASGGEMSRFLLALKACFSRVDPIGTLVFDEIDVGVSGRVAQTIAEKLYQLGRDHQVLCVTHQPLVAAMADAHYHVGKHIVTSSSQSQTADAQKISALGKRGTKKKSTLKTATIAPSAQSEEDKARAKIAAQSAGAEAATQSDSAVAIAAAERTVVKVTPLDDAKARREELAQLAGGRSHTEALAFADSLLLQAETIRQVG